MWTRETTVAVCRRLFPILIDSWAAVRLAGKNSEEGTEERSGQKPSRLLRVTAWTLFGGLAGYALGYFGPETIAAGQSENTLFALMVMFPLGLLGGFGFGLVREMRGL
jgi:hypothetical protein